MTVTSKSMADDKDGMARKVGDLESTVDMLRLDKAYLTKEVAALTERTQQHQQHQH
jgi:hypothetical protein